MGDPQTTRFKGRRPTGLASPISSTNMAPSRAPPTMNEFYGVRYEPEKSPEFLNSSP